MLLISGLRWFTLMVVLLPGAWCAWTWRSMPHASYFHDDGLYYVSAKSLAESGEYTIESLPTQPAQTKYPPLLPAILSIAWHLDPHYPDNLPYAMFLCWMWLPLSMLVYRLWLQRAGFSPDEVLLLCVVWAVNPYIVLFSTIMLSEMPFTFILLSALLCLNAGKPKSGNWHWAAIAGVLSGLAFLTRTAGIALLPAAIAYYGLRGKWRQLGVFAAGMLPSVVGWAMWSARNRTPGTDDVTLYYTNYFGYFLSSFQWKEIHLYVWKNIDGMVHGLGSLLLPFVTDSVLEKVLAECLAIAGIIGVVRLVRANWNSIYIPYATFAVIYILMLAVWNFPANERFMIPVAPLWLAGFLTEMKRVAANIAGVFRKPETSQKVAGGIIVAFFLLAAYICGSRQWTLLTDGLPRFYEDHADRLRRSEPSMAWIRDRLPLDARFVALNDPLLYLRTGRRGAAVFPPTIYWYRGDQAARVASYENSPAFAVSQKLQYVLVSDWDWSKEYTAEYHQKIVRSLQNDPRLEEIHHQGPTTVYRVR